MKVLPLVFQPSVVRTDKNCVRNTNYSAIGDEFASLLFSEGLKDTFDSLAESTEQSMYYSMLLNECSKCVANELGIGGSIAQKLREV